MRVLLVEDDEIMCKSARRALTGAGHTVDCVNAMAKCAHAVVTFNPELVFLDLGLPDVRGTETLEAMQGLLDPDVPIVVYSADPLWKDECVRLGADEFMSKIDFRAKDLPAAVNRAVSRRRLAHALDRHANVETSWPGHEDTDTNKVADGLLSLAGELRALVGG